MSVIFGRFSINADMSAVVETKSVYDVAPATECQTNVGLLGETLIAPFAGEMRVGGACGRITIVVNEKTAENTPSPLAFAGLTPQ